MKQFGKTFLASCCVLLFLYFLHLNPALADTVTRNNFQTGNNGKFDAELDTETCVLKITVKVKFSFSGAWPGEQAKTDWKNDFLNKVDAHWSGKFDFVPKGDCELRCEKVTVQVELKEAATGEHFKVDVRYTKAHRTSSVTRPNVKLDSKDLEQRERTTSDGKKRKQTGAFHEFGHMVGNPEDYTEGDGIMQYGDDILKENYDPFKKVLKDMFDCEYDTAPSS
jgi:hypothetical protein